VSKLCTVFVDDKLWVNIIDDMNSGQSWAEGGIIFLSKSRATAFIKDLREFNEWEKSKIVIKYIKLNE